MEFRVSIDQLDAFADTFWQQAGERRVFAFHGPMGAGKTTLITALCRAKGVQDTMSSPTFSIINEYVYRENGSERKIYHMDLYRLRDEEEATTAGVEDVLYSGHTCFVEWPEKAPGLFDNDVQHVTITPLSDTDRLVTIGS
jgi:tRNA threonylcarbamoyladenosine biosynthesis protein TsaE